MTRLLRAILACILVTIAWGLTGVVMVLLPASIWFKDKALAIVGEGGE